MSEKCGMAGCNHPEGECLGACLDSGWIEWKGGECPVPSAARVDYRLRNGVTIHDAIAECLRWHHDDDAPSADIVDYRLSQPSKATPSPADDITAVLAERGARYGKFTGHAQVTQNMKALISQSLKTRHKVLHPDQQEALDMICHKIGRIVNGDPNYADSWVDIAGYAKLVADRLNGTER